LIEKLIIRGRHLYVSYQQATYRKSTFSLKKILLFSFFIMRRVSQLNSNARFTRQILLMINLNICNKRVHFVNISHSFASFIVTIHLF